MVDRRYDVELEFSVRGCLEDTGVDFYLLDAGPVQLFQCRDDAGFLASSRGAIDEEMGEVAALGLLGERW